MVKPFGVLSDLNSAIGASSVALDVEALESDVADDGVPS
jgi:hypothetical protein